MVDHDAEHRPGVRALPVDRSHSMLEQKLDTRFSGRDLERSHHAIAGGPGSLDRWLCTAVIAMPDFLALSIATCIAKRAGTWPSPPPPSTSAETGVSLMTRGRAAILARPSRRSRS